MGIVFFEPGSSSSSRASNCNKPKPRRIINMCNGFARSKVGARRNLFSAQNRDRRKRVDKWMNALRPDGEVPKFDKPLRVERANLELPSWWYGVALTWDRSRFPNVDPKPRRQPTRRAASTLPVLRKKKAVPVQKKMLKTI